MKLNEESVFTEALAKSDPRERAAFLDQACAGDPGLRDSVDSLLAAHEAGSFLETPAVRPGDQLKGQAPGNSTQAEAPTDMNEGCSLDFLAPSDKPGVLGRLAHYDILEVIGRGGMGIVLRAFDEKLHRVVAIKVMAAQLATNATARKRFSREAQAQAAVSHDHIVTIHAVEEANGLPYLVMHYVAGMSLQERLDKSGALQLHEILRIGMQTASGLVAAHAQGLIHRDIKPANILLENGVERVKVTDFGLARAARDASLTQSGVIAGTPHYMSPEQAEGKAIDQRTDLFSLGSVLYAMCTGRAPFRASGTMAILKRVCEQKPTAIRESNTDIPEWLVSIIDKLHAKDPAERYQTATEVAELLGRHLAHVQHPSVVAQVSNLTPESKADLKSAVGRRRWVMAAAAMLPCLIAGLGFTEATGVTNLRATMIRIVPPDGTLIVEVDDPAVKVTIEGDGGIVFTGAGPQKVRLRPGSYEVRATKDGKPVKNEVVTITRGGKHVVTVRVEGRPARPPGKAGDFLLKDALLIMNFEKDTFYKKDGKTYVRDLSANGNDGLCEDVAFTPEGKVGGGLKCGDKGKVLLPVSLFNHQANYTITAWVRLNANALRRDLFNETNRHDENETIFSVHLFPGVLHYFAWNQNTKDNWVRGAQVCGIPSEKWVFLTFTLEKGGVGTGSVRLTVDDKEYRLPSQQVDSPLPVTSVHLGWHFNGVLDEVTVFHRVLSAQEIEAIRQRGIEVKPLAGVPDPPAVPGR